MSDVYYSPEEFGLRKIAEMEWDEPRYSFDLSVIWRDVAGRWLVGSDSGCSCPSPFESQTVDGLDRFDSPQAALESLKPRLAEYSGYAAAQYAQLAETVMREADPVGYAHAATLAGADPDLAVTLAGQLREAREAIKRVRAVHVRGRVGRQDWCMHCAKPWPCDTAGALEPLDGAS